MEIDNLSLAKLIIEDHLQSARLGIFNSVNTVEDKMITLYRGNTLQVDICSQHEYFKVFGLSWDDFNELRKFYNYMVANTKPDEEIFDF